MSLKDEIIKTLKMVSATFPVTRPPSDELDFSGTPATNTNYGKPLETDSTDLDILMYCQHVSDNDTKNGSYIEYQKRGYVERGLLKIKSLSILKEKDVIEYSDGFKYEVFEKTDRYIPNISRNIYQYAYTQALALKVENQ